MAHVFRIIMGMSLAGSVMHLLQMSIRPVTERWFSARWHYYLQLVVVLLLLIPLPVWFTSVELKVPAVFFAAPYVERQDTPIPTVQQPAGLSGVLPPLVVPDAHAGHGTASAGRARAPGLTHIWWAGVMLMAAYRLGEYLRFSAAIGRNNRAVLHEDVLSLFASCKAELGITASVGLVTNHLVGTPLLMGFGRPIVVLPEALDLERDEMRYVFIHELTHYARGDLWVKVLALIANTVHWYNPLSYSLLKCINKEAELSCDEAVVAGLSPALRKQYAGTILNTLARANTSFRFSSALCESNSDIKRRLTKVFSVTKITGRRLIFSLAMAGLICAMGFVVATATLAPAEVAGAEPPADLDSVVSGVPSGDVGTVMQWPLKEEGRVVSLFGRRVHPISGQEFFFSGIDIDTRTGSDILAAKSGTVVRAEWQTGYGRVVAVDHGEGLLSLYAHCSELLVEVGDEVYTGQLIARVGSTGRVTSPMLRFEVHLDGEPQDPLLYIAP